MTTENPIYRYRSLRKLHTEGTVQAPIKKAQNVITTVDPLLIGIRVVAIGGPHATTQELLTLHRLLLVRQRLVRLDRANRGDQIVRRSRSSGFDGGGVERGRKRTGIGDAGTVRAVPLESIG